MDTPNKKSNVIDMQSYRDKKAAAEIEEVRELSQAALDEIVAELAKQWMGAGLIIQTLGDMVEYGHIDGVVRGNLVITKKGFLLALSKCGWLSKAEKGG